MHRLLQKAFSVSGSGSGRSACVLSFLSALALFTASAGAESVPGDATLDPAAPETCFAVFSVMAYAYADDDLKERQLEEKKLRARADMRPHSGAVAAEISMQDVSQADTHSRDTTGAYPEPSAAEPADDRIQAMMDVLTEMMLERPGQAQGIAKHCFQKYPPEVELE